MQLKVKVRLSDTSTLMREAAVDLVGRFLLSRPGLIDKYYDMLCDRTVVRSNRRAVKHTLRGVEFTNNNNSLLCG